MAKVNIKMRDIFKPGGIDKIIKEAMDNPEIKNSMDIINNKLDFQRALLIRIAKKIGIADNELLEIIKKETA